jgi:hypothetical protein
MSPEWLTALGTLGTFVVIAASAAAALFQLRHMRGSNQIVALTEVRETIESESFQAAERLVSKLAKRLDEPAVREDLLAPFLSPEYQPVRYVANFFETFGAFVKNGIIDENIACDLWSDVIVRNWNALELITSNRRTVRDAPRLWENFEYLASISKRFLRTHPHGTYPRNMERLPLPQPWPEAKVRAPHDS